MIYEIREVLDYVHLHIMFLEGIIEIKNEQGSDAELYVQELNKIESLIKAESTTENIQELVKWTELNNFENDWSSLLP